MQAYAGTYGGAEEDVRLAPEADAQSWLPAGEPLHMAFPGHARLPAVHLIYIRPSHHHVAIKGYALAAVEGHVVAVEEEEVGAMVGGAVGVVAGRAQSGADADYTVAAQSHTGSQVSRGVMHFAGSAQADFGFHGQPSRGDRVGCCLCVGMQACHEGAAEQAAGSECRFLVHGKKEW